MSAQHADPSRFAERLRRRERLVGYWIALDNPVGTERIAALGYDYVGVDGQHGVTHPAGWQAAMLAIDGMQRSAGVIRVPFLDRALIGSALDVGARAVIVPMVESAAEALAAVRACRHAPMGTRSYAGPVRAQLRLGTVPRDIDSQTACIVMIETRGAMEELEAICATPGLDGVYVGPADLSIALGARFVGDEESAVPFEVALSRVTRAAEQAGVACGIHSPDGGSAARRLSQGFTFATVSSDITHLEQAAATHLAVSREEVPRLVVAGAPADGALSHARR